jgi:hypothetical protein
LKRAEKASSGRVGGIPQQRDAREARRNLLEQFEPLCSEAVVELVKAGGVMAGMRKTVDEPACGVSGNYGPTRCIAGVVGYVDLRLASRAKGVLERLPYASKKRPPACEPMWR